MKKRCFNCMKEYEEQYEVVRTVDMSMAVRQQRPIIWLREKS